jgi:hypothetical protein
MGKTGFLAKGAASFHPAFLFNEALVAGIATGVAVSVGSLLLAALFATATASFATLALMSFRIRRRNRAKGEAPRQW